MNAFEFIGIFTVVFLCAVGATVVGRCAWKGAKVSWNEDRLERQAQREFERKVMGE